MTTSKLSGARLHRPYSQTLLSLSVAALFSAISVPSVQAAGLGRLTVQSALGQPLKAEVEVTSLSEDEASSLSAKLASPEAFRQAGLEFNPALTSLQFRVNRTSNGRAAVSISSNRPINEPFVDLLVELNWASGKFVREYTFLLDPPELRLGQNESVPGGASIVTAAPVPQQPVATAQPQPVNQPPVTAISRPPATATGTAATPAAQPMARTEASPRAGAGNTGGVTAPRTNRSTAPAESSGPSVVTVVRGDTLGDIARRLQPGSATLEQAIVAIYRANPDAFFGSVHQLRAGTRLNIPSSAQMASLSAADVRAEMQASNKTWRDYRARLAEATRATTKITAESSGSSQASGTISAAPTDTSPATDDGDQLKLSRDTASSQVAGGSTAAVENSIARDSALQEAQSRVTELERNVKDLQRLLELKNKQLSDLSDQVSSLETSKVEASAAQPADAPAAPATTSAEPTQAVTDGTQSTPLPSVASEPPALAETSPAAAAAAAAATAAANATDKAGDAVASPTPEQTTPPVAKVEPAKPAAPVAGSWLDSLMSNPLVAVGIAGLIALVGGLFFWRRRKSKDSAEDFEDTVGGEDAFAANSLFGTTGGHDVDTSNSLFQTEADAASVGASTVDVHSTEVDPIAEAEVYIAYGREAQAEEILKEALKRQPERQAIRLKLLEIYAGRKDAGAYSRLAREMYDMSNGQNEEWPKVITMGLAIDPDNTLYTGDGDGVGPEDFPTTTMAPPPQARDSAGKGGSSTGRVAAGAAGIAGAATAGTSALVDALSSNPAHAKDDLEADGNEALDLNMPDTLASETSSEPKLGEPDSDDIGALDFDLDIATEMDNQPDTIAAISDTGMDAGLAFESDDTALKEAISNSVEMPSLEFGADASEKDAIADLKMDIPSLDSATAMATDSEVDLSAIGLDLEPSGADAAPAGSEPARWQEMATKLDLASAYEEIGDKEGARELLDEVIKGGDNAQQQKARAMLSKIS
ncbi:MAG: FimV/HubP family polar landmark protein [Burkholderiaceae bacterium]